MRSLLILALTASPALAWQSPIDASRPGSVVTPPVTLPGGSRASSASDNFDRASGSDMGADWTEMIPNLGITNNTGYGMGSGTQWMLHNSVSDNYADSVQEIDFLPDAGSSFLVYTALICGVDTSTGENIFIKVQDNTLDLIYDQVYFYHGINGNSWGSSPYYFDLATPTPSGRMRVTFTGGGDIAVLDIDNDFDGTWDEQFQCPGLLSSGLTFGTGFGIGCFDATSFDNWAVNGGGGRAPPTAPVTAPARPAPARTTTTAARAAVTGATPPSRAAESSADPVRTASRRATPTSTPRGSKTTSASSSERTTR